MCEYYTIGQMISLALVFVVIVTKAYKKSYATTVSILSVTVAIELCLHGFEEYALLALLFCNIALLARTFFHHSDDRLVRL